MFLGGEVGWFRLDPRYGLGEASVSMTDPDEAVRE